MPNLYFAHVFLRWEQQSKWPRLFPTIKQTMADSGKGSKGPFIYLPPYIILGSKHPRFEWFSYLFLRADVAAAAQTQPH